MRHSYFDHNATAPVAPEVLQSLFLGLAEVYGNASSIHHFGQLAKQRLEAARRQVAANLGCDAREVVFTSGGTESDNLAIFGIARLAPGCHVITTAIEHPAVLNACAQLEREGHSVTYLNVADAQSVQNAIRPSTALISVMHANNETGELQPIAAISAVARAARIPFHTDAVQTAGRLPLDVRELGVDLLSLSGHKFGAPKGIGALYVRKGVELQALLYGGRHERERRAGTENVAGAAALAQALALSAAWAPVGELRDHLEREILAQVPAAHVNGDPTRRLPNTSNIRFDGIEGEAMVISLDLRGFAVSSGSACSSGAVEPSHVLLAMGLSSEDARSSVRFSLGPSNTKEEVNALIEAVVESVAHLRRISATFSPEPAHV